MTTSHFYPRSPRGERRPSPCWTRYRCHFYPRSPRGERPIPHIPDVVHQHFYPRSPRGERLVESEQHAASYKRFLSTLPARGATRSSHWGPRSSMISIHAPREGSDRDPAELFEGQLRISIHAPREGSDRRRCRGAAGRRDFYPRSPRGERRAARGIWIYLMGDFYPRSPRGERPVHTLDTGLLEDLFLSTLPARGATFSW